MKRIMFISNYVHTAGEALHSITATVEATLIDEAAGNVMLDDGDILEGVEARYYAPLKDDLQNPQTPKKCAPRA